MTQRITAWAMSPRRKNDIQKWSGASKSFLMGLCLAVIILGVCYVILSPVIGIISRTFMSPNDITNPLVFLFPQEFTLDNLRFAFQYMSYINTLLRTLGFTGGLALIHVIVCSLVGYGFARFNFPGKGLLFALVIVSIVIPIQSYIVPMFLNFQFFMGRNLIGTAWPIVLLTVTGVGIRSGLYIFIFRQFFRGVPKDIEEAAFIDGASSLGTYIRIMIPNAIPALVTVLLFAFVWHYNDTYYVGLLMPNNTMMAARLSAVGFTYSAMEEVDSPILTQLVIFGGVLLAIAPIMTIYLVLQRFFVEGLERSGIVG